LWAVRVGNSQVSPLTYNKQGVELIPLSLVSKQGREARRSEKKGNSSDPEGAGERKLC